MEESGTGWTKKDSKNSIGIWQNGVGFGIQLLIRGGFPN